MQTSNNSKLNALLPGLSVDNLRQMSFITAAGFWLAQLFMHLLEEDLHRVVSPGMEHLVRGLCLNIFLLCSYFLVLTSRMLNRNAKDYYSLLFSTFSLSGFLLIGTILGMFIGRPTVEKHLPVLLKHFDIVLYNIILGVTCVSLFLTFHLFKQLILLDSSKRLRNLWNFFEVGIISTIALHLFSLDIHTAITFVILVIFGVLSLSLTFNFKWILLLSKAQKRSSILFLLGIMSTIIVLGSLLYVVSEEMKLHFSPNTSLFFISVALFVFTYGIISSVAVMFSLPMSSAFENKMTALSSLENLNAALLDGSNSQKVYLELLDTALKSAGADAGWLEISKLKGPEQAEDKDEWLIVAKIKQEQARKVIEVIRRAGFNNEKPLRFTSQSLGDITLPFQSVICIPLVANKLILGTLTLLKEEVNGFDAGLSQSMNSLTQQASLAIQNFRFLAQAVETERYREEIKIAHRVQKGLLPASFDAEGCFEVAVHSFSADVVGGDYYDYYKISSQKYAVIIGDVSGNGTTAAFHMAQMKGIFHSLVRFDPAPDDFFNYANDALASCLEKKQFITATYLIIDSENSKIYFSRAGHCPTIYYNSLTQKAELVEGRGLGLGILRSKKYAQYSATIVQDYQKGDKLLLFTDGISEARGLNSEEEYGSERMRIFLENYQESSPDDFCKALVADMAQFTAGTMPKDDFTVMYLMF